jgi:hypothetical protein
VDKKVCESYSLEVAIDRDCGLLVAGDVTQIGNDQNRLSPLVQAAERNEPCGVQAVDGDSGYYRSADVSVLISRGVDVCIPDPHTASELHRGLEIGFISLSRCAVSFEHATERDCYVCPEGNALTFRRCREMGGEDVKVYQAYRSCGLCPRYSECITNKTGKAKYKQIIVRDHGEDLAAARDKFNDSEHRKRYLDRGSEVETVFGFVRGTLGFDRWLLRSAERVKCEGKLMRLAYQLRKVHGQWAATRRLLSQAA